MWKKPGKKRRAGEFDKKRFISEEAAHRYESILTKALVPERGFNNPGGRTEHIIYSRDWQNFTQHPGPACIPLVREFYANAPEHNNYTAFVRGKWIPFDKRAINALYHLPNIDNDGYSSFCDQPIDYNEILSFLCKPDSGVSWKRHDGKPVNFHSGGLNSESKAWHYFISAKLMPTMNTSEVTRDRAVLNYCIQSGISIDVGAIIFSSIRHVLSGKTTAGLGHPSMIDDLCGAMKVYAAIGEETQTPKTALTKQKIFSYSARSTFEIGEGSGQQHTPQPRRSVPLAEQVGKLKDEVSSLSNVVHEHTRWHERTNRKIDHMLDQQMQHYEYVADFNSAIEDVFARCSFNPGNVEFPEPPSHRFYVSPAAEEEDDDEDNDESE